MERIFIHEIVFDTKNDSLVSDVARSLIANEEIIRVACSVLEKCATGLKIDKVDIKFGSTTTNSPLKETLLVAIFTTWQSDLNARVPEMIEDLTGIYIPDKYNQLITIIVLVIVIYGIDIAYKKYVLKDKNDKDNASISINGDKNIIFKIAGDMIGVDPESITDALESSIGPLQRDSIAKKALEFIRPAKKEGAAKIIGGGAKISAETIAAAPSDLDLEISDEDEFHEHLLNQVVVIHATDLDKTKTGWAGHLPGVWENRIKMQLYPGIDPKSLFGKTQFVADVILASRPSKDGSIAPYLFHVVKLHD